MTAVNLATAEEFHAEIARLLAAGDRLESQLAKVALERDRLRAQPCPYVTGNVTKHCTLTPVTLTDAERAALQYAAASIHDQGLHQMSASMVAYAATLRGLLERTETGEK